MTKAKVFKLATEALKKYTYADLGAELIVNSKEVRKDDDWWYIPVHPSKELKRIFPYYDVLAMATEELESHKLKVQFIPA